MKFKLKDALRRTLDRVTSYTQLKMQDQHYETMKTVVDIYGNANGTILIYPKGVNIIYDQEYEGNTTIKAIAFPTDVKEIGWGSFLNCTKLSKIDVPYSVERIDSGAFTECRGATEITISENLKYLGAQAFSNCLNVKKINYNAKELTLGQESNNGCFPSVGKSGAGVDLVIGNKVKTIPSSMFVSPSTDAVPKITSITFQEGRLETIGMYAFFQLPITSICIPANVKTIGAQFIGGCDSLETITVDPKNTVFHGSGNCLIRTEDKYMIAGCKNSVIPADGSVEYIDSDAFAHLTPFDRIVIPNGIKRVSWRAFFCCYGLKNVTFFGKPQTVDADAFISCNALKHIYVPWSAGEVAGAPWGATNATVHYNQKGDSVFYIADTRDGEKTACFFEEGMTWGEWIASDYNTVRLSLSDTGVVTTSNNNYLCRWEDDSSFPVYRENEILADTVYTNS